jgi:hypothetical protein
MLKNNIYNIDREFDYVTVKAIVVKSLEKLVKAKASKKKPNSFHDVIPENISDNLNVPIHPATLLKLKIRNTTKYFNWRLSILKRDNFTCKICHTSVNDNKG